MLTQVKFLNPQLGSRNQDHPIEKKHEGQFPTTPMLVDEIEKKINFTKEYKIKSSNKKNEDQIRY